MEDNKRKFIIRGQVCYLNDDYIAFFLSKKFLILEKMRMYLDKYFSISQKKIDTEDAREAVDLFFKENKDLISDNIEKHNELLAKLKTLQEKNN